MMAELKTAKPVKGGLTMATDKLVDFDHVTDYISRQAAINIVCHDDCEDCPDGGCDMYRRMKRLPAADVVEVVRCKDCKYWRDAYVKENDGTERQYRDDDVDPLGMMGVTIDIGSNIWSMCLLENNCGWELNKSIFRNENDFCSRGEKRPCSYEKWWGISDGIYPKPDIKEG